MILITTLEQYNNDCIFFSEPTKNNIINESKFIKIYYSNELFTLNGIYMTLQINNILCEKYYNKYKCSFNYENNVTLIQTLKNIEEDILKKYSCNKPPEFKLFEQLQNKYIKIFDEIPINKNNIKIILKISGLWETDYSYGLTYKFFLLR